MEMLRLYSSSPRIQLFNYNQLIVLLRLDSIIDGTVVSDTRK